MEHLIDNPVYGQEGSNPSQVEVVEVCVGARVADGRTEGVDGGVADGGTEGVDGDNEEDDSDDPEYGLSESEYDGGGIWMVERTYH